MLSPSNAGLIITVCCLVVAVALLFLLCKYLQKSESRKFNSTPAEEFGDPGGFVGHPDAAASTVAGGYVLIPAHMHQNDRPKNVNGEGNEKTKIAPGMDPRDPDAWKRHDSQTDSFAERKDDPWKCESGKSHSSTGAAAGAGVVVVGTSVPIKPGEATEHGVGVVAVQGPNNPEGVPVTNQKLVNGSETGEDTVDAAVDGEVFVTPFVDIAPTIGEKIAVVSLEPKITVVPLGREDTGPSAVAAPSFSTVGFWEAQEAAHNAAKYGGGGGGGGGDSYSSNYGNDGGSSAGFGSGGGGGGGGMGDSSYGGGYYGSESTGTGGNTVSGDLPGESS